MSTQSKHSLEAFEDKRQGKAKKKNRYKKSKAVRYLEKLHFEQKRKYTSMPEYAVPKTKFRDDTSNGLTRCVIEWIELDGGQAERINSTGRYIDQSKIVTDVLGRKRSIGSGKWIKGSSQRGTADISATIKGRSVKIEVKCRATGDHYQSVYQKSYQKEVERAGGLYFIARDFTQFVKWYIKTFGYEKAK